LDLAEGEVRRPPTRRGLIAGAAALVAAGLAKLAGGERAEAGHDNATSATAKNTFHLGQINTGGTPAAGQQTNIFTQAWLYGDTGDNITAFGVNQVSTIQFGVSAIVGHVSSVQSDTFGIIGRSPNGIGVSGESQGGTGVRGTSTTGDGVLGQIGSPGPAVGIAAVKGTSSQWTGVIGLSVTSSGVLGITVAPGPILPRAGVVGSSTVAPGVAGSSTSNVGVHGISTSNVGVHGISTSNVGILGEATAASNASPGVYGSATRGYGVFGFSQNRNGVAGQSGGGFAGCVGFAGAPGGYGIYGGTAVQGGYAGGFAGPVLVVGDFTVSGGAKNAAVPHPDGTHRLLYCQESPEPWFEDFGDAKLVNGRAQVKLDPNFAAVVHSDKYLIYLTPEGDTKGLYVSGKDPAGFEVRETQGGTGSLTFNYRVVARRKDIPGPRLEKVKLPELIKELKRPPEPPNPAGHREVP